MRYQFRQRGDVIATWDDETGHITDSSGDVIAQVSSLAEAKAETRDFSDDPAPMECGKVIPVIRTAVTDGRYSLDTVRRYLPSNYQASADGQGGITITGEDVAGWTLDGYVIPRLASGLIFAREVGGR